MKKLFIPALSLLLILGSCTKTEKTVGGNTTEIPATGTETAPESTETTPEETVPETEDKVDKTPVDVPANDSPVPNIPRGSLDKVAVTDEYIYSGYPADNLPMEKLPRTITNENQVVYVQVQDAKAGQTFHVAVEHQNPQGNIAVNHVYGPKMQDGPFGRYTDYTVPKDGDYTFAFSKNKRAEGSQKGEVLITVVKK